MLRCYRNWRRDEANDRLARISASQVQAQCSHPTLSSIINKYGTPSSKLGPYEPAALTLSCLAELPLELWPVVTVEISGETPDGTSHETSDETSDGVSTAVIAKLVLMDCYAASAACFDISTPDSDIDSHFEFTDILTLC